MKTVCAWCGGVMRDGDGDGPVSHGICGPCAAVVLAEMEEAGAANTGPGEEKLEDGERATL